MIEWWNGMLLIQQIFALIAIPATVILIIQTILLLFGMGHGHDVDTSAAMHDVPTADPGNLIPGVHGDDVVSTQGHEAQESYDSTADAGLRLITVRGLVALFAIGGWTGVVAIDAGASSLLASLIAIIAGLAALFLVAWIIKLMLSLQSSGNMELRNAVGLIGDIYLRIPGSRKGTGKITVILQGRSIELDAVTDEPDGIATGKQATVTAIVGDRVLVKPL